MGDRAPHSGTPRWVIIFGIIALVLVLLVSIMLLTSVGGVHRPRPHSPSAPPREGVASVRLLPSPV